MKTIILTTNNKEREVYINNIKAQIHNAVTNTYQEISPRGAVKNYINALSKVKDNEELLMLEDDVILCDNFLTKLEYNIKKTRREIFLQCFSMRNLDLTKGSRFEYGSTFLMNQAVFFPKGEAKKVVNYFNDVKSGKIQTFKNTDYNTDFLEAQDIVLRDYLRYSKQNYYIIVPNLVNHAITKSLVNPRRSTKRQSKTFER